MTGPGEGGGRIRVFVADDHPLYLEALCDAIRERRGLELVGQAHDWQETAAQVRRLRPEVAVLDLKMPGAEDAHTTVLRTIEEEGLPTRVLFLSAHTEGGSVYDALAAGARGYMAKSAGREAICGAIVDVARGRNVLAGELQAPMLEELRSRAQHVTAALTPRERDVLTLAAEGRSNAEIAQQLYISRETVKSHLQKIYEKLDVPDRAAAVAKAIRLRLIA